MSYSRSLLLDFSAIKSGGGAQLALNFLSSIKNTDLGDSIGAVLVSDKFPWRDRLPEDVPIIVSPSFNISRIIFEYLRLPILFRRYNIDSIYTFFGPGLPHPKRVKSLVGIAYPILFYDESPYWGYLSKPDFIIRKIKNFLRGRRIKGAEALLFETDLMRERAFASNILSRDCKTFVLPPTPTKYLKSSLPPKNAILHVLLLSGLDPHKNLWRLPEIVRLLQNSSMEVKFLLSVTEQSFLAHLRGNVCDKDLINKYFTFLGPISSDNLQFAYDQADVLMNISDLESFSNNYMEAWVVGRPIIASDRDFAREICGGSAYYVDPHDPTSVVKALEIFSDSDFDNRSYLEHGKSRLVSLPTLSERVGHISEIIFKL